MCHVVTLTRTQTVNLSKLPGQNVSRQDPDAQGNSTCGDLVKAVMAGCSDLREKQSVSVEMKTEDILVVLIPLYWEKDTHCNCNVTFLLMKFEVHLYEKKCNCRHISL